VNRRTLDKTVPALYVIAILIAVFAGGGRLVAAVAVIGAMLVGLYWSAIRRNLKP
jgi:hypothetical protein